MKRKAALILSLLYVGSFSYARAADFDDYARVLSVSPRTEQFNQPRQECWTEEAAVHNESRGVGGAVIGGLAGALLGSQIGRGNGRIAGAAVGGATGAIVGDRMQNSDAHAGTQPVQRCRTVDNWQTRVNGYFVTYDYRGHTYTDVLPHDPGERMRVHVQVAPRP